MAKMIIPSIQAHPSSKFRSRTAANHRTGSLLLAAGLAVVLAACSKPAPKVEDVRPVRVMRTVAKSIDVIAEFPGEVRPRIESRLGFRVGGKIIARKVDVGAAVKRGQVLMQLDPQDLQLAQAQARAALKAAESNHQLAKAELTRYQELQSKNFVSPAVLDSKNTAYQAARASYDQAVAVYRNQSNMAGYATLVADADGVVAGIDAEVGQVVSAGTPVLRLAQLGEKEIVIGIPEDKVEALRNASDVTVRIWAMPDKVFAGRIREIAPMADQSTRTYTVRVAIPAVPDGVKLGMTAYVAFASTSAQPLLRLPLSALFQDKAGSAVWLVENGAVRPVPVQLAGPSGNEVLVAGGLAPGQTVVTAGVNLLKPGQKVKILGEEGVGTAVAVTSANADRDAKYADRTDK